MIYVGKIVFGYLNKFMDKERKKERGENIMQEITIKGNKLILKSIHYEHTFEIVDFFPYGYHIWNISHIDNYLPLCVVGGYDGCQVIKSQPLKAIKLNNDDIKLLSKVSMRTGCSNIEKMEKYLKIHINSKSKEINQYKEMIEKAIIILKTLKH